MNNGNDWNISWEIIEISKENGAYETNVKYLWLHQTWLQNSSYSSIDFPDIDHYRPLTNHHRSQN
jgi:hypothetical protein